MRRLLAALAHALLLSAACGGGGGGGAPQDATAQGTITGTGSIAVTGTLFGIDAAATDIELDGDPGDESDLAVGMQVTVEGSHSGDTGTAHLVTFDDDIEGPIDEVTEDPIDEVTVGDVKELSILGQTVLIEDGVTLFEGVDFRFETIAEGDVVEVSGLRDGDGDIHATWLRLVAMPVSVSLEGEVESLTDGSFMIGPIHVDYDKTGLTDLVSVPEGGLAEGDFVDVLGVLQGGRVNAAAPAPNNVVELEERAIPGNRSDVQLEGIVAEFASSSDFELSGQPVDAGRFGVDFEPDSLFGRLADGDRIEVEGGVSNGVLVARAVRLRAGEVRIEAGVADPPVVDLAAGTLVLLDGDALEVDVSTRFADLADPPDPDFDGLGSLQPGDLLDVRGVDLGAVVRATEINRVDSLAKIRVRGRVDSFAFDGSDGTFSIVGVGIEEVPGTDTGYLGFPAVSTESEFYTFLSACPDALLDVTADPAPDLDTAETITLVEACTP